ncbi:GIY-YIG nuclease family protein [Allorhodopirellula solitaria]|uniref:GIY-YIG nuclease family protein n=1 Tax=Allorhodopirellula solitaria TaxID=2527987 RepID=UPI001C98A3A4|nr:GIY-YIG nuclease family protein [Allorhodopirellula solitaria]
MKVGRSTDVASRRRELQCGCPFELMIEYIHPVDDEEAITQERRYRAKLRSLAQQIQQTDAWRLSTSEKLMPRWFPFVGEIEAYVLELKNGESPESAFATDQQSMLF